MNGYIGDYPILLRKWKQHTWGTVNLQTLFLSIVRYPNEIMIHTEAKRVYSYFVCSHGISKKKRKKDIILPRGGLPTAWVLCMTALNFGDWIFDTI